MGYEKKIVIETNSAENKYCECNFPKTLKGKGPIKLLFLARIEEEKGIKIALDALTILNREIPGKYELYVAGTGSLKEEIQQLCSKRNDTIWVGYVTNEKKHQLLDKSHVMLFPTYYPEGMPITLLEAVMYGMPIVSRPVGGISDLIVNNENGFLTSSLDPREFAVKIDDLTKSEDFYRNISTNNIEKSKLFMPENVRTRLMNIYKQTYGE